MVFLFITQVIAVIFYGIYHDSILKGSSDAESIDFTNRLPYFQDIHIMIYIGFGFLLCFIHQIQLTSLTMCFWISALSFQYYFLWSALWKGWINGHFGSVEVTPYEFIAGEASIAAQLIALCAIIGKTNNLQFLIMTVVGVFLYCLNEQLVVYRLGTRDIGGGMIIHTFGAFYGLGITFFLNYKKALDHPRLAGKRNSFTLSMIGTLFLWCYWPSFNGALATNDYELFMAYINTYFSLIGSTIGTYMLCMLLFKGRVNMDQILNSTLAGGVVMGAGADMLHKSYVAYIVGAGIGIISSALFEYMPRFLSRFQIQDVAGVLNLHGVPGLVGGLCSAAYRA